MSLQWYIYVLAVLAGVVAGIINTLAGSGSLITLPMLIFLGLPANLANATNRVGVLMQNIVGVGTFKRGGQLSILGSVWLTAPAALGSVAGALLATRLNAKVMNTVIGVVMVVMLGIVLFDPQRWLREKSEVKPGRPSVWVIVLFTLLGVYGGFIQAGVGVFLLAALVLGVGYNLVEANGIKLVIVLAFTVAALVVFAASGQINWGLGVLLGAGQSLGAWLAARFALKNKRSSVWVRWLLVVVIVASILKLFGLLPI
jgi:uncharacterized protein